MFYRDAVDIIIWIENSLLGQLVYYWLYYNSPCDLLQQKAKTQGLTGVRLRIDNPDTASFVFVLVERLQVKLYDKDKKPIDMKDIM
ncbi:hypothetical protein [Bacteroides sp.]|uniref:hypothetical protein n=1 Tax=Bacteroides sp. TaxID=29523 RepID=UPI00261BA05E|nr:hypothetical protein [Bacteroides sp.]MDD3040917.1 hypothetical protein [Bacteroides sp.]